MFNKPSEKININSPDPNSDLYISEGERFNKDFATYDYNRRNIQHERKKEMYQTKKNQLYERERKRWEKMDYEYLKAENKIMMNKESSLGDMTLLADEPVRQQMSDGKIEIIPDDYVMSLAIPITRSLKKVNTESFPFKNIVSIDQGEAGFAYAVFKLSDCGNERAEPIATGLIPIPSIRRLIHSVKKYRGKKQRIQNFNQKFDSTMFTLRENVTGDICGLIVALMKKYNAFPIV